MERKQQIALAFVLCTSLACFCIDGLGNNSSQSNELPNNLFAIPLGTRFYLTEDLSHIPEGLAVNKLTGAQQGVFGTGLNLWFKPSKDYEMFPYVEQSTENAVEGYFQTSFRLFLMPIVPKLPAIELDQYITDIEWEVFVIEWQSREIQGREKYYWAKEMCRTFELDFEIEPKIYDFPDHNEYKCEFFEGEREFSVEGSLGARMELRFNSEKLDQRDEQFQQWVRESRLEAIRPYD